MENEFLKIIEQHQGIIRKVCRLYCRDRNDSEDLFQEIVLQLWKSFSSFKKESKVSTWMYKIALNTAISGMRKSKRKPESVVARAEHENISGSEEIRIDIEYQHELQNAINRLNSFDKAVLVLYLEEKTYKEMAEILGLSESNIGVKLNRIKTKLKEQFVK